MLKKFLDLIKKVNFKYEDKNLNKCKIRNFK